MSNTFPMVLWGSVDDLTAWSQTGTCSAGGGQLDPFGGTTSYGLTDDDGAVAEARYKEYTATYTGYHYLTVFVRPGTGTQKTSVKFENITLSDASAADVSWASYVPTLSTGGTLVSPLIAAGNGYYIHRIGKYATAGNTVRTTFYPAGRNTASDTATGYFYLRNCTLLDVLDNRVAWEEPRDGSTFVQGGSGSEDAWIQGTDFRLQATVNWIPPYDRDSPAQVSGWGLPLERAGVNCGVSSLLRAGRNKETLTFYYDRTASSTIYGADGYLVDPMNGAPTLLPNGDRSLTFGLRSASTPFLAIETT